MYRVVWPECLAEVVDCLVEVGFVKAVYGKRIQVAVVLPKETAGSAEGEERTREGELVDENGVVQRGSEGCAGPARWKRRRF